MFYRSGDLFQLSEVSANESREVSCAWRNFGRFALIPLLAPEEFGRISTGE